MPGTDNFSGDGGITNLPTRGERRLLRAINRNLVLTLIKSREPVSRADVARTLGLSPATVTQIVKDLVRSGLVNEGAAGPSAGGRPPIQLSLRHDAGFAVGVKITERGVIAALTDLDANLRARHEERFAGRSPESVVAAVERSVRALSRGARIPSERLVGIGVGLAGIVDGLAGVCRYSPFFKWRDVPLRDHLAERLDLPVYVDNDVNTLAMAEQWFGAGRGVEHFLTVTTGRGVGLGIVLNGHLYRGASGGAGEFGHTVVDAAGPRCACGKRGCLEAFVAEPALLRAYRARTGRRETPAGLYERAQRRERAATAVLAAAGEILGIALANLVNVLNPSRILLSGEGAVAGEPLLGPLRRALHAHAFADLARSVDLAVAAAGDDEWARGAAGLVLGEMYRPPVYTPAGHPAPLLIESPRAAAASRR
jgi:predicted NBD/HSP70 family sugar kinase